MAWTREQMAARAARELEDAGLATELFQSAEGLQIGILYGILGLRGISENAPGDSVQPLVVPLCQHANGRRISRNTPLDELAV